MRIVTKGILLWFLHRFGFDAFTFWNGCIIARPNLSDDRYAQLAIHESKHIEQMDREGRIKFTIKYLYYTLKYGYRMNPYEVEARKAAGEEI